MADDKSNIDNSKDPNLDSLLDDALEDFTKPPQPISMKSSDTEKSNNETVPTVWTEEFIQEQTKNFEQTLRKIMDSQGNAVEQPTPDITQKSEVPADENNPQIDLNSLSSEFSKFAEAAAKAANDGGSSDGDFAACLSKTMQQLSENNEQLKAPPSADDLSKMFENMGLMGEGGDVGEMNGLFPLMQTMLESILAKDVLYGPLKEIADKYPDWLADNRASLNPEDFEQYNKQFDVMKTIVQLFEEEKETDTDEVKSQRFEKILQSMQKLQEMGQPPKELVGEVSPLMAFNETGNTSMPDPAALLSAAGFNAEGGDPSMNPGAEGEQCSLM